MQKVVEKRDEPQVEKSTGYYVIVEKSIFKFPRKDPPIEVPWLGKQIYIKAWPDRGASGSSDYTSFQRLLHVGCTSRLVCGEQRYPERSAG